jgi:two-component system nitrogen regulation response regulator GlnG
VPDLVRHFFKLAAEQGLPLKNVDGGALERMKRHRWPGNIRELENLVRRLAALYPQETITEQLVETELGFDATPIGDRAAPVSGTPTSQSTAPLDLEGSTLSMSVEHHLNALFRTHGEQLPPAGLYHRILREVEGPLLSAALAATRGNQIKAAELLGLNRNTLRKKVRDLDIRLMRSPR